MVVYSQEVNKLIVDKIQNADIDESVRDFILEILNFERKNWHLEKVHYSKEYDKLILKYIGER